MPQVASPLCSADSPNGIKKARSTGDADINDFPESVNLMVEPEPPNKSLHSAADTAATQKKTKLANHTFHTQHMTPWATNLCFLQMLLYNFMLQSVLHQKSAVNKTEGLVKCHGEEVLLYLRFKYLLYQSFYRSQLFRTSLSSSNMYQHLSREV
jgi:hypothetical protein